MRGRTQLTGLYVGEGKEDTRDVTIRKIKEDLKERLQYYEGWQFSAIKVSYVIAEEVF